MYDGGDSSVKISQCASDWNEKWYITFSVVYMIMFPFFFSVQGHLYANSMFDSIEIYARRLSHHYGDNDIVPKVLCALEITGLIQ